MLTKISECLCTSVVGQCPCFYGCSDLIVIWFCFLVHHGHRVALSDVAVLWDCLCSTGEQQGLVISARPTPGCQGLLFSFSASISQMLMNVVRVAQTVMKHAVKFFLNGWMKKQIRRWMWAKVEEISPGFEKIAPLFFLEFSSHDPLPRSFYKPYNLFSWFCISCE